MQRRAAITEDNVEEVIAELASIEERSHGMVKTQETRTFLRMWFL